MSVKDLRSNLIAQFLGSQGVVPNTTTAFSGVVDNANYEMGVMFFCKVATLGAATSVDLVVQESDDPTFATFSTIDSTSDKMIGTGSLDVTAATAVPTASAVSTVENRMVTLGVFSNKRYLRLAIVDVGGSLYVLEGYATQAAENLPTVDSDA